MKRLFITLLTGCSVMMLLTGCLALSLGSGTTAKTQSPTVGQQLIDLQHAKEAGAINDAEYQTQKAKILNGQ